jgi:hypothetical protein
MRVTERLTPVAAAVSAVATLACCLPLGGAAFLGLGGVLAALGAYQQWLLPLSGVLLAIGSVQVWRTRRLCGRTSWLSVTILATSAVVVSLVAFFPQAVAGFLADWLP